MSRRRRRAALTSADRRAVGTRPARTDPHLRRALNRHPVENDQAVLRGTFYRLDILGRHVEQPGSRLDKLRLRQVDAHRWRRCSARVARLRAGQGGHARAQVLRDLVGGDSRCREYRGPAGMGSQPAGWRRRRTSCRFTASDVLTPCDCRNSITCLISRSRQARVPDPVPADAIHHSRSGSWSRMSSVSVPNARRCARRAGADALDQPEPR